MNLRYRKWGRSVRLEGTRRISIDEGGEAIEDGGTFRARSLDEFSNLPAPESDKVEAVAAQIESMIARPLMIEPDAARLLAEWYSLGAQALTRFAAEIPGDKPGPAVLWPEHFDVGMTAAAINYGAAPGDDHITDPYVYVGPHDGPPPGDPAFWNAPFGAARTFRQVGLVAEAAAFFRDGRARVLAHAATNPTRRKS